MDVYFVGDETQQRPSGLRGGKITAAQNTHTGKHKKTTLIQEA